MTSLSDVRTLSASNESYGANPLTTTSINGNFLKSEQTDFDAAMERIYRKVDSMRPGRFGSMLEGLVGRHHWPQLIAAGVNTQGPPS